MRKYENVDIVAALGTVVELNTEHYKSDFKYDIEMFKEAAQHPDSANNYLLWLSRRSGTYCFHERDVYVKDTAAYNYWRGSANILGSQTGYPTVIVTDRILAYAINIKNIENGRIKGDLYELDYRDHIRHINKTALPKHTVTVKFEDDTKLTFPCAEYDAKRERLCYLHGKITSYRTDPEDKSALRDILTQARDKREKDSRPTKFKVHIKNPKSKKPSIKQQIAEGRKQLAADRAATQNRVVAQNQNTGLGD